jgi:hypothetical protein
MKKIKSVIEPLNLKSMTPKKVKIKLPTGAKFKMKTKGLVPLSSLLRSK